MTINKIDMRVPFGRRSGLNSPTSQRFTRPAAVLKGTPEDHPGLKRNAGKCCCKLETPRNTRPFITTTNTIGWLRPFTSNKRKAARRRAQPRCRPPPACRWAASIPVQEPFAPNTCIHSLHVGMVEMPGAGWKVRSPHSLGAEGSGGKPRGAGDTAGSPSAHGAPWVRLSGCLLRSGPSCAQGSCPVKHRCPTPQANKVHHRGPVCVAGEAASARLHQPSSTRRQLHLLTSPHCIAHLSP